MNWNYESKIKESTGYEDCEELFKYSSEYYNTLSDEEKQKVVDIVFGIYREKNIFPIKYYNREGIHEEIQKCIDKDVSVSEKLPFRYLQGVDLCKFLFPNLFMVQSGTSNKNSLYERFMDDHKLKRTVKLVFDMTDCKYVNPNQLRSKLELIGGNVAQNFHPMKAKWLYEKYCPKDGVIYDFSCGFGGRMLGALSSKNNYTYYGVEPCSETYESLNKLGNYIEEVTGRTNSFELYKCGSEENITDNQEFVDFAFSSPPYFNLERYSEEDTQCYVKYPTLDSWFIGYVIPTIENIYKYLKHGAYYAVNIADYNLGKTRVNFVDQWIQASQTLGFEYVECVPMNVTVRRGDGHERDEKKEGIFVFRKP